MQKKLDAFYDLTDDMSADDTASLLVILVASFCEGVCDDKAEALQLLCEFQRDVAELIMTDEDDTCH